MLTLSKMKYGCELYFDKNLNDLNRIIMQFYKRFYHLRITTPNYCIIGEFGIKPMEFHCYKSALNYYLKLNNENDKKLITRIFKLINSNLNLKSFRNTWCDRILKLIRKTQLLQFKDCDSFDKISKNVINTVLIEYFRRTWIDSAKNSNKGLRYLELCRFQCEVKQYLCLNGDKIKINNILQLRTGNHTLAAEIGTYQNRSTHNNFICKFCDKNEIEDIFHFISICPRYRIERLALIPFLVDCERSDFYETMNVLKAGQTCAIDEFIDKAMHIRNSR